MRVVLLLSILAGLLACTVDVDETSAPPAPSPPVLPAQGGVGEVVEARCPMPVADVAPPQRVIVRPLGDCGSSAFAFPILRVTDADGRSVFPGAVTSGSVTPSSTPETCVFQVRLFSIVPPEKPENDPVAPPGVDVRARLCQAQWTVQLPVSGLEPPVLRDLFFVGSGGQVVVPGARSLPVQGPPDAPGCAADGAPVEVDDFVLGLGFTVEVPRATLARTASVAVGGEALVTFDIRPR